MYECCESGHIDILKWVRPSIENFLDFFDVRTCAIVARWGQLDILKWFKEKWLSLGL